MAYVESKQIRTTEHLPSFIWALGLGAIITMISSPVLVMNNLGVSYGRSLAMGVATFVVTFIIILATIFVIKTLRAKMSRLK